ncbi:hypothetical protein P4_00040 [Xanthomonas phage P4]|uniref:Uncharacterized protein n=1 Tax=Xanthomonas phage P4 TaxID=3003372 RepID=A0A9Y1HTR4_9CAUD|nr:hypothetical protein P4_00040 [Xanthomonas phage P4]
MGFMDKIKAAAKYVKDKVVAAVKPRHDDDDTPPPAPDTSRYLHVSTPLIPIDNPVLRKMLGQDYFPVQKGQGQTRIVANNQMKRVADSFGANNKERLKLRSRMKRRAAELRAGASLQPNVQSALAGAA